MILPALCAVALCRSARKFVHARDELDSHQRQINNALRPFIVPPQLGKVALQQGYGGALLDEAWTRHFYAPASAGGLGGFAPRASPYVVLALPWLALGKQTWNVSLVLRPLLRTDVHYAAVYVDDISFARAARFDYPGVHITELQAGNNRGYILPLLKQPISLPPHPDAPGQERRRDVLLSFAGNVRRSVDGRLLGLRHLAVNAARAALGRRFVVHHRPDSCDFSSLAWYEQLLKRSIMVLCPRGFGPTSYRLFEALLAGAIPVVVYDEDGMALPYTGEINWHAVAVIVSRDELQSPSFGRRLRLVAANAALRRAMQRAGREVAVRMLGYRAVVRRIETLLLHPPQAYPVPRSRGQPTTNVSTSFGANSRAPLPYSPRSRPYCEIMLQLAPALHATPISVYVEEGDRADVAAATLCRQIATSIASADGGLALRSVNATAAQLSEVCTTLLVQEIRTQRRLYLDAFAHCFRVQNPHECSLGAPPHWKALNSNSQCGSIGGFIARRTPEQTRAIEQRIANTDARFHLRPLQQKTCPR